MNLYYVSGTEILKGKRVTDIRAIPVPTGGSLDEICDKSFIEWSRLTQGEGPYPMSRDWK